MFVLGIVKLFFLFVNGLTQNMHEQLTAFIQAGDFLAAVSNNIDILAGMFDHYLSGANNLRLASIILMLLAFILFLFLIIILYVKSIISFLKSNNSADDKQSDDDADFNEDEDLQLNQIMMEEQERERELERELQKELELARIQKDFLESTEKAQKQEKKRLIEEEEQKEREKEQKNKEKEEKGRRERKKERADKKRKTTIDLDWEKGKTVKLNDNTPQLSEEFLSYRQSQKSLSDLLGLMIDMLGRGVDDLKIAQTIMYRNQGKNSEDDVLQLIEAVKDFITLCINGNFDKLQKTQSLPSEADALYHLANGDTTITLSLLENLMDYHIEQSGKAISAQKRAEMFKSISNYANTFGSIAAIHDLHLATGAFELAIELNPANINAWGRLGDMYARATSNNKAIWAYNNVLNQADEDLYARQVANANKMMSQYLYDQGNSLQAAKLYNSSKQYYDSLGINRRLDKQELEIVEIIEANQQQDLQRTIQKILERKNAAVYNF